jgi:hypothetical protein
VIQVGHNCPTPIAFSQGMEKPERLVREERVELSTFGSGGRRSMQLSHSRIGSTRWKLRPSPEATICFAAGDGFELARAR